MTRYTLNITAEDLLDLLKKQRARYSVKLEGAVSASDFSQAKVLINKLEELKVVLDAKPVEGSEASLVIEMDQFEIAPPALPRGLY